MPISAREFDELPVPGQPTDLPRRVMELLQGSPDAYTIDEIAGAMLGRKPGLYVDAKVVELVPAVKVVVAALVHQGQIEVRSKDGLAGPENYYRAHSSALSRP